MIKGKLYSRLEKLEEGQEARKYKAILIIDEGEPAPDNIGPGTVLIIDNIPKSVKRIKPIIHRGRKVTV